MKRITNVVAKTLMEALTHKDIPDIGVIENGHRLVAKSASRVPAYPKWWLVELTFEKLRIVWRKIGITKVKR